MARNRGVARTELAAAVVASHQAKEDERMAQFRALIAAQGGSLTIAKRT